MTEETAGTPRTDALHTSKGWKIGELIDLCKKFEISNRKAKAGWQTALSSYDTQLKRANSFEREVAALTTHLEAEIDSHIASRKSLRERADALEAELDAAKSSVQSITQDYVGMCAVVRGLEAKVTEEMERVDQWKAKYEQQHGLHIAAKDELDAAKRALAEKWITVSERLPPVNEIVLVCDQNEPTSINLGWRNKTDGDDIRGNNLGYDGDSAIDHSITHWQPLPAIPAALAANSDDL